MCDLFYKAPSQSTALNLVDELLNLQQFELATKISLELLNSNQLALRSGRRLMESQILANRAASARDCAQVFMRRFPELPPSGMVRAWLLRGEPIPQGLDLELDDHPPLAAMVAHTQGQQGLAQEKLDECAHAYANSRDPLARNYQVTRPASEIAMAHAWTGNAPAALAWIDKALQSPDDAGALRVITSPFCDGVASDRQWAALRKCVLDSTSKFQLPPADKIHPDWRDCTPSPGAHASSSHASS